MRFTAGPLLLALWATAGVVFAQQDKRPPAQGDEPETIRQMLARLHDSGEFTGTILVARDGVPVYRAGVAGPGVDAAALLDEPVNIASVSKGFTAMAVMMLAERGKLRYDDPVGRYLPALAEPTPAITLRHLLTHTSGIPDVGDLGIDRPNLLERDVLEAVRTQSRNFAKPGLRYGYSNTNYNLLAMVVEAISGQPFDDVLQKSIFTPLGMSRTRAISGPRAANVVKGDSDIASTVDDLLRWDQALANGKLVGAKTLSEALIPARVAEGTSTYGFGWNIAPRNGDTFIWHTGNSGDRRALLCRRVSDRITIIILTKGDSRRLDIADAVVDILHHRPYTPPRLSIARALGPVIKDKGVDEAIALYHRLRTTEPSGYDFAESELNGLGYSLLGANDILAAIRIFELNVQQYPASSNVFDSLGEAYKRALSFEDARKAYARAVELDPANSNARAMLQQVIETQAQLLHWTDPPRYLRALVEEVIGKDPLDCGQFGRRSTPSDIKALEQALTCARDAAATRKPFWMFIGGFALDSWTAEGLMGDNRGTIATFGFDNGTCGGPGCPGPLVKQACSRPALDTTNIRRVSIRCE